MNDEDAGRAIRAGKIVDAWRLADLITTVGAQEIPRGCSLTQRELLLSFVRLMAIRIRLSATEEAFGVRPATAQVGDGRGDDGNEEARAAIVNSMAALAIRSGADVDAVGQWMASVRDPHDGLSDLATIVRSAQGRREKAR